MPTTVVIDVTSGVITQDSPTNANYLNNTIEFRSVTTPVDQLASSSNSLAQGE